MSDLWLLTATPKERFGLANTLARRGVEYTQPNAETLHALRPAYAEDAAGLTAASHAVAVHFTTVVAANDHWRDQDAQR